MGFKRFSLFIVTRTVLAMASLTMLVKAMTAPGYHAVSVLLAALLMVQLFELIRFVSKTNAELVRFFDAARNADYSQRFDLSKLGSGFDELGQAFDEVLARLQHARTHKEEALRHVKAVVEHVPVPLISIQSDQHITLWNNSARRLFGTHPVVKLDDLTAFNSNAPALLAALKPGTRSLITMDIDGVKRQLSVSVTEVVVGQQSERLVSLQDIQSELDAAQLEAWQDLVRVLTHEIMNSITPVASLANTAAALVEDAKLSAAQQSAQIEELDDAHDAVTTVARRSDSLMAFVNSYRQLTRLGPPNKTVVSVKQLLEQVQRLACQSWIEKHIQVVVDVEPTSLAIEADAGMIEQVLLNLLINAEHATADVKAPQITIRASLNTRGHVVIEVADNGVGMNDQVASKVFVPFYTTKPEGSGVGLALTRQIMLAHGGSISLITNEGKGSKFSLLF
ncbi:histidine kinase [Neiella marina]|uniref:histidine kinase n=1 Tax=Neiella marina TaxID=508461 RepID=A0A8J2U7P3_9GAMM|nr:ATP-binding protein [Neiella marina]GGA84034.1 histidine kinase [Neiella marina]